MPLNLLESGLGAVAALVAAITGVINVFLLVRGKTDKFVVRYWSVHPQIEPGHQFSLISISDHPIYITDFGYISDDLTMHSIGIEQELGHLTRKDVNVSGKPNLEHHGQVFDIGIQIQEKPLAVYGHSATRRRPKVAFNPKTPYWKRLLVRARILLNPTALF